MDHHSFRESIQQNSFDIKGNLSEIYEILSEIAGHIPNLQTNRRDGRPTWTDWEEKEEIVRKTKNCADLTLDIFAKTDDGKNMPYSDLYEVYCFTFAIGTYICEIVCKLCIHVTLRFSSRDSGLCASICKLPHTLRRVLDTLKRTTANVLSTYGNSFLAESIEQRNNIMKTCIDFKIFVCKETTTALRVMKRSKFRPDVGFKELLACVVKQFHYIEQGCELTQLIIQLEPNSNIDMNNPSSPLAEELQKMFKQTKRLLINGRYVLRSLSYEDGYVLSVNAVCEDIRNFKNVLQSGTRDLKDLLEDIKGMSSVICKLVDLGDECLKRGIQQIEGVTITLPENLQDEGYDDDDDKACDFLGFINDGTDDKDNGNIKTIPVEEIKGIFVNSGVDESEIINVFKMEGFQTSVQINVDNNSAFIWPKINGKVFKKRKWISATDVKIKGTRVSMTIKPGEFFVVHYEFPRFRKTFSKEEIKKGQTIQLPGTDCSVVLPPSDVAIDVTITCKIHLTDNNRLEEYKEENPREYGDVAAVFNGVQMNSTAKINKGVFEYQRGNQLTQKTNYFCLTTSRFGSNDWKCDKVKPEFRNKLIMFELNGDNKISYFVAVNQATSNRNILDLFLTILGFKAQCKLLTLYRIPEEQDATIDLCVSCIESKGCAFSNQTASVLKDKWIQIEENDVRSDFYIAPGDVIRLTFKGNVQPKKKPHVVMFVRKGSCSANVQLHHLANKDPPGYVEMDLNDKLIDSKKLDWSYLFRKYEMHQADGFIVPSSSSSSSSAPSSCSLL